jgi:hypothetical protein
MGLDAGRSCTMAALGQTLGRCWEWEGKDREREVGGKVGRVSTRCRRWAIGIFWSSTAL